MARYLNVGLLLCMLLHKQTKMEKESALIAYMPREIAGVIVAFLLVVLGTFSIVV